MGKKIASRTETPAKSPDMASRREKAILLLSRFDAWAAKNELALQAIDEQARRCALGGEYGSVQYWVEIVRSKGICSDAGQPFSISNDYAAVLGRKLIRKHPELSGTLNLRASVLDALDAEELD